MNAIPTLVSHVLCPYVQRAVIVLTEKGIAFERRDVDLADKPDWFLRVSPLGKTPVLLVGSDAIFESAVICEYLDETTPPRWLGDDPLRRARQRMWIEYASALLNAIAAFYNAPDDAALAARAADLRSRLARTDAALAEPAATGPGAGDGPYFEGPTFGLVDAAFAPVFRYFDAFDAIDAGGGFRFCDGLPRLAAWRRALARRPSVASAVRPDYDALLDRFLRARGSALSRRMAAASTASAS